MEQLRIFLSHSSQDKAIADRFVRGLREAGADVWYDEHNLGAGHLMDEIQRELESRPIFIVLLSKAAFASAWVKDETDWTETDWTDDPRKRDHKHLILPITIRPIDQSDFSGVNGWLFLHSYKRIEAPGYQPYPLAEIIERTCRILGLATNGTVSVSHQPQSQESVEAWGLVKKGNDLRRLNRNAEALAVYDQALELDPRDKFIWSLKFRILQMLGRTTGARA